MSDQIPYIRVFISSPGDVNAERQITLEVIDRLPYRPAFRDKVAFRVIAWDKPGADTPMRATLTPQEAINQGLPLPAVCDIVVVLFWSRMGTPFTDKDGQAYQSGTHWELMNALESKRTETVIYRRTDKPPFEFTDADFDAKRDQYQRVQDFFNSEMFYKNGQIQRGVNMYSTPDDFREKFETHFEALVVNLLEKIAAGKSAPENLPPPTAAQQANIITIEKREWTKGKSPFPGLVPFTADDAAIFFGRGHETDALVKQVMKSRFVAVVGASGSGKSSLVGAGLLPQLRSNAIEGSKDWIIARFTPGTEPFTALANALIDHVPALHVADPMDYPAKLKKLVSSLQDDPDYLPLMLTHAVKSEKVWAEVVLFIDQFEELFTVGAVQAQAFARMMQKVAASERVRTLVTIRADFAHQAIAIPEFSELFRDGFFALAIPKRDALRQMIERPAERAGLTLEAGLVERMLDDTGNEPGNLALLAYMLDELYRAGHGDGKLTQAEYDALGGVQGAIGKRSESVYAGLDDAAKNALPTVFRELVEVDERGTATRRRAQLARVTGDAATKALVNTLTNARLLVQNTDHDGEPVVEVAHEALLRNWERLATWITETQDDLLLRRKVEIAAYDWDRNGRREDYLWSQGRLDAVFAMQERLGIVFDGVTAEFLRPELDRLFEEFKNKKTPNYRRQTIIDRLEKIGVGSVPYLFEILPTLYYEEDDHPFSDAEMVHNVMRQFPDETITLLLEKLNLDIYYESYDAARALGNLAENPIPRLPSPFAQLVSEFDGLFRQADDFYDDEDDKIKRVPVEAISDPRIVPALLQVVQNEEHHAHWGAVKALGKIGSSDAIAPLLRLLHDENNKEEYDTLITALGRLQVAEAVPGILKIAAHERLSLLGKHEDSIIFALGQIGHADAVPLLSKWLSESKYSRFFSSNIIIAALDHINSVECIPALEKFIRDYWYERYTEHLESAITALARINDANILPLMRDLCKHDNEKLRLLALKALLLSADASLVEDVCRTLIVDEVEDIRQFAIFGLVKLNSLAVGDVLIREVVDTHIRDIVCTALLRGSKASLIENAVLQAIEDANPAIVQASLDVISKYNITAAYDRLFPLLADERIVTIDSYYDEDEKVTIRHISIEVLGEIGDASVIPHILPYIQQEPRVVIEVLGKIGDASCIPHILPYIEQEPSAVLWALGEIGDASVIPHILPYIEQEPSLVKEILQKFSDVSTVSQLLPLLGNENIVTIGRHDDEVPIRHFILEILSKVGDASVIPHILPYIQQEPSLVIEILGKIGDGSVIPYILPYIEEEFESVMRALVLIGDSAAIPHFHRVLQNAIEYEEAIAYALTGLILLDAPKEMIADGLQTIIRTASEPDKIKPVIEALEADDAFNRLREMAQNLDDEYTLSRISVALIQFTGANTIPILREMMKKSVVAMLGLAYFHDVASVPLIIESLENETDEDTKLLILLALRQLGTPEAFEAVRRYPQLLRLRNS